MEINIQLELNEVNALLDIIGQLPTSTNTWPLAQKIRSQAALQVQQKGPDDANEGSSTD